MDIVYNDRYGLHPTQKLPGRAYDGLECPARVEVLLGAVREAHLGDIRPPTDHGREPILAVHAPDYIEFLEHAYARNTALVGQPTPLYPEILPPRHAVRQPDRRLGVAGYYATDADSPILEQTWEAAYWSAQCALTAADALAADPAITVVYALCRPPGHHAGADMYGGFCYLNNAAIAARHLQQTAPLQQTAQHQQITPLQQTAQHQQTTPLQQTAQHQQTAPLQQTAQYHIPIAILDIDFHHGNGTQLIFYSDPTVHFCSLHGDPDTAYPFYYGGAEEIGAGVGAGFNRNWPLPQGTEGPAYLRALEEALAVIQGYGPRYLVVSAGFDTSAGDPYGGFRLTPDDLRAVGARIAALKLPTLIVQEGGYLLSGLAQQATAFLGAFA